MNKWTQDEIDFIHKSLKNTKDINKIVPLFRIKFGLSRRRVSITNKINYIKKKKKEDKRTIKRKQKIKAMRLKFFKSNSTNRPNPSTIRPFRIKDLDLAKVEEHRNFPCQFYSKCLFFASAMKLRNFSCKDCFYYLEPLNRKEDTEQLKKFNKFLRGFKI